MKNLIIISVFLLSGLFAQVDYDTQIQPIWNSSCTICHTSNDTTGLNLTTGNSYNLLVDVASTGASYGGALRVASGDTNSSVIWHKMNNSGTYGGVMPPSGMISASNRALVSTWITELGSADYITIADARNQAVGTNVTIRGIVTTPNFQTSHNEFGLQDATAGIIVFHYGAPFVTTTVGDSIEITGDLDEYNGKFEIVPSSEDDITVISSSNDLPAFQVVTVANYVANGEDYESELIRINSASITSGTWPTGSSANLTISDDGGTSTVIMRIDSDMDIIGNPEPAAPFDVQGIAGQYNDYQILPRYYSDFIAPDVDEPPDLLINEFLAATDQCCDDGYGEMEDFIEIFNPGTEDVDIGGLWITDNLDDTDDWEQIPTTDSSTTTVAAGGHIVIWADKDQSSQGILHTDDIKLSADGEDIGLIFISGTDTIFVDSLSFGAQTDDISYGRYPDGSDNWIYFDPPSPGTTNVSGVTVTDIYDIQYTTDASGDSPLDGQEVTISGVVTAEFWGSSSNRYLFVQDAAGPWNGVVCFEYDGWDTFNFVSSTGTTNSVAEGDSVTVTGTVDEYYCSTCDDGLTEIVDVSEVIIHGPAVNMISPTVVTPGQVMTGGTDAEAYEGCLVKVDSVTVDDPDLGNGEWLVTDGTNSLRVDDIWDYYYFPESGQALAGVAGVMTYTYSDAKLEPRLARDVVEEGVTRIQRINQVLYSDLLKVADDNVSDMSYYMEGDTFTVEGIVTVATGLAYAGTGVKLIFEDYNGGPWSGMVCYSAEPAALGSQPIGRKIRATGLISEYGHDSYDGNVTEIDITQPIQVLGFDPTAVPVDTINTGDIRVPLTAEQWGAVWIEINNAMVIRNDLDYGQWTIDDGSGEIKIGTNSESEEWTGWERPPVGSFVESIRGWVYHRHGYYSDSTAYKLEPNYPSDITFGAGPPIIAEVHREPCVVSPSDQVQVSTMITDNSTISQAFVHFRYDGGVWDSVAMSSPGADDIWSGDIPSSSSDDVFVEYYISAYDDGIDQIEIKSSHFPNIEVGNYMGYISKNGDLTIYDIQYSPWPSGVSPYIDCSVTLTGIVTVDSLDHSTGSYNSYAMQSASAQWSGIFFDGYNLPGLARGDEITTTGKVYEHYGSTNLDSVTAVTIMSTDNVISPLLVSTADLAQDSDEPEAYEGCLVTVSNVDVTSINMSSSGTTVYDWSIKDDSGISCLMDDDMSTMEADNFLSGLEVGSTLETVTGIFNFSFGTYKIEVRDMADLGQLSIDDDFYGIAKEFALYPNFPNPFNPETRIRFQLAENSNVKLMIYDVLGRKVCTLVSDRMDAGHHIINWDGLDDKGIDAASGMYIYRIKAGDFIDHHKMLLIR